MTRIFYVAFATLAGLLRSSQASHVVDLGVGTFDEFVSSHRTVMVEFYAPWFVSASIAMMLREANHEAKVRHLSRTRADLRIRGVHVGGLERC